MSLFSKRTRWDASESTYAEAIREARASGHPLLDLTLSNPTRCGFTYDPTLLQPLTSPAAYAYDPDPCGILSAREAVALYYSDHRANVDPGTLLLTTSTSESYSFLFRLLCDPGDEVLVPQPSYPLFDFLATLDDVRLRPYPLFFDHGWSIDVFELERTITARTRAILIVHPNNPTGHWTTNAERQQLEALCVRHNLALIVDEVFLDYGLHHSAPGSGSFCIGPHPALTFVLSGLSKICGLPQMKAAWIVTLGPDSLQATALERLEIIADTFLSISSPVQLALPFWLATRSAIQSQILRRLHQNLATLTSVSAAPGSGVHLLPVDAGWTAIVSVSSCTGDDHCAEHLVRAQGIVLHPGSFYGLHGNQLVSSLLTPPEILITALACISRSDPSNRITSSDG